MPHLIPAFKEMIVYANTINVPFGTTQSLSMQLAYRSINDPFTGLVLSGSPYRFNYLTLLGTNRTAGGIATYDLYIDFISLNPETPASAFVQTPLTLLGQATATQRQRCFRINSHSWNTLRVRITNNEAAGSMDWDFILIGSPKIPSTQGILTVL